MNEYARVQKQYILIIGLKTACINCVKRYAVVGHGIGEILYRTSGRYIDLIFAFHKSIFLKLLRIVDAVRCESAQKKWNLIDLRTIIALLHWEPNIRLPSSFVIHLTRCNWFASRGRRMLSALFAEIILLFASIQSTVVASFCFAISCMAIMD